MAKVLVNLKIKIAVGVHGIAVMSLDESVDELYGVTRSEITVPSLTMQDIECCGVEEWYEYSVDDKPVNPGVYEFIGRASFDEDSADYSFTCKDLTGQTT